MSENKKEDNSNKDDASSLEDVLSSLPNLIKKRVGELKEYEKEIKRQKKALEEEHPSSGKPSDILSLNVGGTCIQVSRRILISAEGSMLASKFSGRWDDGLEKDKDGKFFIDEPIDLFLEMINYLRSRLHSTPKTPPLDSPKLGNRFHRMVEFYGASPVIFPNAIYQNGNPPVFVKGHPDYCIETGEMKTFCMLPEKGNDATIIKSYEVVLGDMFSAKIGWMIRQNTGQPDSSGVGYSSYSVAFDCDRHGIVAGGSYFDTRGRKDRNREGVEVGKGTVIRCDNFGKMWYVNGILVASPEGCSRVARNFDLGLDAVPCFSVKGKIEISSITLHYK